MEIKFLYGVETVHPHLLIMVLESRLVLCNYSLIHLLATLHLVMEAAAHLPKMF
jgi:hypothetical protein